MRLPARSAAWLLPLLLAGCTHKNQVAQNQPLAPPIVDTPPKVEPSPTNLPPPVISEPAQPDPAPATPPPEPVKKTVKHKKPTSPNTEQASNGTEVPAIGQLTTADPPVRQQADATIESTEKGLNSIKRQLSDQEQNTAAKIRELLKEARAALTSGDVEGAHDLATKAKVLLEELHP
jgi:hypothetical protein